MTFCRVVIFSCWEQMWSQTRTHKHCVQTTNLNAWILGPKIYFILALFLWLYIPVLLPRVVPFWQSCCVITIIKIKPKQHKINHFPVDQLSSSRTLDKCNQSDSLPSQSFRRERPISQAACSINAGWEKVFTANGRGSGMHDNLCFGEEKEQSDFEG